MALAQELYVRVPAPIQNLAVTWYTTRLERRRYGAVFRDTVPRLVEREKWPAERLREHQVQCLRRVCANAKKSPFYRQRIADAGLEPETMSEPEDIRGLARLTKDEFRRHGRELLTATLPRGAIVYKSSGTTGTPAEIIRTAATDQLIWAFWEARCWSWCGTSRHSRRAIFGVQKVHPADRSNPPFWRTDLFGRLRYFSIYHLAEQHLDAYLKALLEFRPELIIGYPNALLQVARHMVGRGRQLEGVRAVVTTSETLVDREREVMEAAFGCPVFDQYGAAEACVFGATCEHGHMHLSPDYAFIEVVRPDGRLAGPGESGEVVCTGFVNPLQPIIRYQLGDVVRLAADQGCPCGREFPVLEEIVGRVEDTLFTLDGRAVIRFDTVFKGLLGLREAQVAQVGKGRFEVRVVPDQGWGPGQARAVTRSMEQHLGSGHHVDVIEVSSIPRTAAGKFRAVVNEVGAKG